MDWNTRKCAALSAARGVAYLHAAHSLTHGNLKSSNLLLRHDDLDAAALSDYSLQHLFSPPPSSMQRSVGGYRAPELVDARRPTFKSDIYSLGVLFLEILTGRAPTTTSIGVGDGGVSSDLPRWVQSVVREEWTAEVFDAELVQLDGGAEEEMVALLQVAMACVATTPDARPDTSEVVRMVEEISIGRVTTKDRVQGASEEEQESSGTPTTSATS
nr:predicted protein [Hordeum vulgare subsp. vulgare]